MDNNNKNEEIMKKCSQNMRRVIHSRENVPCASKSVKFNPETVETSFGGTQSSGKIQGGINQPCPANGGTKTEDTAVDIKGKIQKFTKPSDKKSTIHDGENRKSGPMKAPNMRGTPVAKDSPAVAKRKSETPLGCQLKPCIADDKHMKLSVPSVVKMPSPQKTPVRGLLPSMMNQLAPTPECFNPVSFATPVPKARHIRSSCDDELQAEVGSGVTVAVRVRPYNQRELFEPECKCVVTMCDNETLVQSERGDALSFTYDYSFWSFDEKRGDFASQEYVYNTLAQPLLGRAFEGYNICLFAYGQTSSGKSYSMMGHGEETGIIPRFCEEMFGRVEAKVIEADVNVEISYFEIYNEKIHDLLGPSNKDRVGKKTNLKVREHPSLGPYVEGLSSYVVTSFEDIKSWLSVGSKHRATASTGMNDKSSRSHSVFTLILTQTRTDEIEGENHKHAITSKINLVDLAGSERQSKAKTSGDRLREGASINKSLMALGKVISQLSDQSTSVAPAKKKKLYIPYRDSVLTWMLKESLGGNAKTAMLATISPSSFHTEETLSTLRYAKQARAIINQARVNEDPKAKLIRELRGEIDKLRSATGTHEDLSSLAEVAALKEKLRQKEQEMDDMSRSWEDRLKRSEQRKLEEARSLERSGIAFKMDQKLPNLVNLNEDPQLSEMLLYVLREGATRVGRMGDTSTHEIQLSGPLIADDHCILTCAKGQVTITPLGDAQTYVNGDMITMATTLHHGDRVILGGDHYFRFSHPEIGVRKSGQQQQSHVPPKDFEFARQELNRVQNAKLDAELEEARKKHEEELRHELDQQEQEARRKMAAELAKSQQQADRQLTAQRCQYEDKLSELEKSLQSNRLRQFKSEQQKKEAHEAMRKLERQKEMLEKEVLANRKRLQLEAAEAQKAVQQSASSHWRIMEQLEREKAKVQQDVVRLEALRQKRGASALTPRLLTPRTPAQDSAKKDLYRSVLKVREANKISQYLGKDTVFSREDMVDGGEDGHLVRVTNTKLAISTFWTMAKFEDRLLQMRELYQCEGEETGGVGMDEVFYDPGDAWEKNDLIESSPGLSPRILQGLKRQGSVQRLSFDSVSSGTPARTRLRSACSSFSSASRASVTAEVTSHPVMAACREHVTAVLERYTGEALRETGADKILDSCQCIKRSTTAMLQACNEATDGRSKHRGGVLSTAALNGHVTAASAALHVLLSHSSTWSAILSGAQSPLIGDLCEQLVASSRKLGTHLVHFMQGCENDIDSMVQEAASQILDAVFMTSQLTGELAVATETALHSLRDYSDRPREEAAYRQLGPDIRLHVISGCDRFIDRTLQGGLRVAEECEVKVMSLDDELDPNQNPMSGEMLKQVEMTVASAKVLMQKLQQIQVELDSTIRDSIADTKPENSFYRNYLRGQSLITYISNLTDGVSLLTEATLALMRGEDTNLRRLCRSSEMVYKASAKILATSAANEMTSSATLSQSDSSDYSVLSDSQMEQVDVACQEIKLATRAINELARKSLGERTSKHT